MIDLRPNCVAEFKMNDDLPNPWVVGLNGLPTERVKNNTFENDLEWLWGLGWEWLETEIAHWRPSAGYDPLSQIIGSVSGEKWAVVFEVKSGPGDIELQVKIGGTLFGTVTSKGKKYVFTGTAGDVNSLLEFVPISGSGVKIDNVFGICLDNFPLTGIFYEGSDPGYTSDHSVAGKINTALHLDGVNDRIIVDDEGALNYTSESFSIVIWIRRNATGSEYLITRGLYEVDGWELGFSRADQIQFRTNTSGDSDFLQSSIDIEDTDGHLVIGIKDGANSKILIDNVEVASGTLGNPASSSRSVKIGCQDDLTDHFEGDVDVTRIIDKALSEAEGDMLWHGGKGMERLISLHYHIYRGQDGNIDYSSPAAEMELDDSQVTIPGQGLPANTIWHYIRRQIDDECGLESDDSPACIVAIDSNGDMIGSTPNPPISLTIERLSNGRFRLRWRYTKLSEEVTPTGFKIYMDSGSGFNFASPDATIAYGIGGINNEFSWISGALTHGQIYRFCVRSYRTDEGESQNTDYVATDADSEGPAAITDLQASYEEI